MYFFWLSLVSLLAALLGVRIAWSRASSVNDSLLRRLYTRLRLWLTADERNLIFRRTLMSSVLARVSEIDISRSDEVSVSSAGFSGFQLVQADVLECLLLRM